MSETTTDRQTGTGPEPDGAAPLAEAPQPPEAPTTTRPPFRIISFAS